MRASQAALLHLEWSPRGIQCPLCQAARPVHRDSCTLDHALSELGVTSQADRDAARLRVEMTERVTVSPPSEDE
jgi:hypothetical protein